MRIFTQGILARRKIVFIFLLAILLPSLVVGYLSLSTFSRRREAVKNILESNRWISGEAALKSFEEELLELEKEALMPENFTRLAELKEPRQIISNYSVFSEDIAGKLFLLDDNFQIIFPITGSEDISVNSLETSIDRSKFADDLKKAEIFEFSQRNYSRAADLYRKCAFNAPSNTHEAAALEGLGRCFLSSGKYSQAYNTYHDLSTKHGQLLNKAEHPYGILAAFQLSEIENRRNRETESLEILIDLYDKIRGGFWPISLPTYDFFISEIESIIEDKIKDNKFSNLQESYHILQNKQSLYLQTLIFADFLKRDAIPKIKEKVTLSRLGGTAQPGRLLATQEDDFCLVSFTILPGFRSEKNHYGGFCWDHSFLKKEIFPRILGTISEETGLHLRIIDEKGKNIFTAKDESIPEDSLKLSYRRFPFPWKLLVSQPALGDLKRTARREIFLYGVLLAFIVALMLLGTFLIVRDISRESETTRLKTEFVHNISHEFKTPLTLIRLYGETLQRKENLTKEERKECYEIITKESERLSHLINNVLDFSRIDMGKKEFDFKKGNLSQVVRDTLESYRYHLEKKGFAIQTEIATDLPEMIFDGEAMASVLINLLSNAMKFSPKIKEVIVKLFKEEGNAVLQVTDKGIGISPKEISKVFKRFYRSKNEIVSDTRGSGLGLTLVKHITEAHGGKIKVDSEPGKGSIFSIILPVSNPNQG